MLSVNNRFGHSPTQSGSSTASEGGREPNAPARSGIRSENAGRIGENDFQLVRMKQLGRLVGQHVAPGGVSPLAFKIAERVEARGPRLGAPRYQIAERDETSGNVLWYTRHTRDGERMLATGKFIFVTMLDGEIRLGGAVDGQNAHGHLAGGVRDVRYAGTVTFEAGVVKHFSNVSGTFVPPGFLRYQSNFGVAACFSDHDQSFETLSVEGKLNAEAAAREGIMRQRKRLEGVIIADE